MIKKDIADKELLSSLPPDGREIYLLSDGQIRLTALSGTFALRQMQANFSTGVLESLVLGKGYLAGGLLSSTIKGNDRIQLTVECGGPIGGLYIEAWACGAVRGYLKNNPIPLGKPLEDSNLSPLFGPGFLTISKILEGNKQPFSGQIMLEYGNLAKDLALYYQQSEQTPSLFDLSIQFDQQGGIAGAGGLFFQVMPGCKEETLTALDEATKRLKSLGLYLQSGKSIDDYVKEHFASLGLDHLASEAFGFSCPCNKDQFGQYLKNLPQNQRQDILSEGPFPLELVCVNCNSAYTFSKEELMSLLNVPASKEKK